MSIVEAVPETAATGLTGRIYADDVQALGYVPSHTKVLSLNPEAYAAWRALQAAIAGSLGLRRYELVTLAAARGLNSRACLLAHGKKSLAFMAEEDLIHLAGNHHEAGLSAAETAMMDYALKLSTNAAAMNDADSQTLREAGFSDRDIVDITLAAAARNYFSRALQALAVDVDVPPGLSPALQEALTAGCAAGGSEPGGTGPDGVSPG